MSLGARSSADLGILGLDDLPIGNGDLPWGMIYPLEMVFKP
jgi:hypothetical protein